MTDLHVVWNGVYFTPATEADRELLQSGIIDLRIKFI